MEHVNRDVWNDGMIFGVQSYNSMERSRKEGRKEGRKLKMKERMVSK